MAKTTPTIITHSDFDGVVSAALCVLVYETEKIRFSTPEKVFEISIAPEDIVCDLPYPFRACLWFDHHQSNLEQLPRHGVKLEQITGHAEAKKSCARVIYDYFKDNLVFPEYLSETVAEADKIDAFEYSSIEEWLQETPAKIVRDSMYLANEKAFVAHYYLQDLVLDVADYPLAEVAQIPEVKERYALYCKQEAEALEHIKKVSFFVPEDTSQEILILDLTQYRFPPQFSKNLSFIIHPNAEAVLLLRSLYRDGKRSNDIKISFSLNAFKKINENISLGAILKTLGIGDGHASAAGAVIPIPNKSDREGTLKAALSSIYKLWKDQAVSPQA